MLIMPQSDTTLVKSFLDKTQLPDGISGTSVDVCDESAAKTIQECLSSVVGRYLAAYLEEHKNHLPVGKLYELVMGEVEKSLFAETLRLTKGNQKKASEILGINRNTLRKRKDG